MVNQLGPRVGHTEPCRARVEKAIAEDENDDRTKKAKERADHFVEQQIKADPRSTLRGEGPRQENEPNQEDPVIARSGVSPAPDPFSH